ncbi:ATP-grasp domain-containing protein [Micromonospora sp. URMC 107]|uniref:ATP-grasp domain-containing protein n=1 Tax=Micromonospora sp. URMC 107 TaxID=3423418 RepID=UPI003F197D35
MLRVLFCKWDETALRALAGAGARIVLLLDEADVSWVRVPDDIAAAVEDRHQVGSLDSIEELEALVADLELGGVKIDRVATTSELAKYGAGYLGMRLGLDPDGCAAAANSRDKRRMKTRARAAGVATAEFATIRDQATEAQLAEVVERVGLPLILKPSNGVATIATSRVHTAEQLAAAVAARSSTAGKARQLIAERCLRGDEYHVDAVWRDGRDWVFAVSRYFCPRLTLEEGERLNGAVLLPEDEHAAFYARVRELHDRVNTVLGIRDGATHLELFHDPETDELYFSEVATRVGGANIPEMVGARFGVDVRRAWAHELLGGDRDGLPWRDPEHAYVAWLNLTPSRAGRIVGMPGRDELLAHPHIVDVHYGRTVGERISFGHPSAWCLMLVLAADTERRILELIEEMQVLAERIVVADAGA